MASNLSQRDQPRARRTQDADSEYAYPDTRQPRQAGPSGYNGQRPVDSETGPDMAANERFQPDNKDARSNAAQRGGYDPSREDRDGYREDGNQNRRPRRQYDPDSEDEEVRPRSNAYAEPPRSSRREPERDEAPPRQSKRDQDYDDQPSRRRGDGRNGYPTDPRQQDSYDSRPRRDVRSDDHASDPGRSRRQPRDGGYGEDQDRSRRDPRRDDYRADADRPRRKDRDAVRESEDPYYRSKSAQPEYSSRRSGRREEESDGSGSDHGRRKDRSTRTPRDRRDGGYDNGRDDRARRAASYNRDDDRRSPRDGHRSDRRHQNYDDQDYDRDDRRRERRDPRPIRVGGVDIAKYVDMGQKHYKTLAPIVTPLLKDLAESYMSGKGKR